MIGKVVVLFALMLACVYSSVLVALLLGLFKVKCNAKGFAVPVPQDRNPISVSVIVAARNEEENLAQCLKSLLNQTYPEELYEVIVVDDNSTDNTLSIARSFAKEDKRLELLSTTKHHILGSPSARKKKESEFLTGKQHALDTGISASKGEIILTTDADCEAPHRWIEDTIREFDPDVGLVAGFSLFNEEDISHLGILQRTFIKLQSLELLSIYIASIGSMSQGFAWACTGNNLAYRREVYRESGGFETLGLTGAEDSILLQWVDRHSKWKVKPTCNVVYTKPMETVSQFLAQRIRWASSIPQYRLSLICFMVIVYGLNLFVPLLIGLSLFGVVSYRELIIFLGLKTVPEFLIVLKGLALFNKTHLIKYFLLIQPLHVMYVLICGIYGLSDKFAWKGRKYSEGKAEGSVQDAK